MIDNEDDKQYFEYLKIRYPNTYIDIYTKRIYKRKLLDIKRRDAEEIYASTVTPEYKTDFSAVLFPNTKKLGNVPLFRRYVAYLVDLHGYDKASELLYLSKTTLWRFIKFG